MKKPILFLFYLLSNTYFFAQVAVSGTILNLDGKPLEGASVYINNSSMGTTSNDKGEFYLNLPKGQYDLVVSYVGFESIRYPINTNLEQKPIKFKMTPKTTVLNQVVIKRRKKMSINERKRYLRLFRSVFLGDSKLAQTCEIENEKTLDFDYDPKTKILEVSAQEPLQITNRGLGYNIVYDLVTFELTDTNITYLGYVRYQEREGKERRKKRWKENRQRAYKGSHIHFLRAVKNNEVRRQGFMVDLIDRKPNPRHPSAEEIAFAQKVLQERKEGRKVGYMQKRADEEKDYYKAVSILRRAETDRFIERTLRRNVREYQYTLEYDNSFYLRFPSFLKVTYMRELPEKGYLKNNRRTRYQVSMIKLYKEEVAMNKSGELKEPLDVLLLGYWAYEKVGDALPLDYLPAK